MKMYGMSHNAYSDSTALTAALTAALTPAHSGPELSACVPDTASAQELARTLLADCAQLDRFDSYASSTHAASTGRFAIGFVQR